MLGAKLDGGNLLRVSDGRYCPDCHQPLESIRSRRYKCNTPGCLVDYVKTRKRGPNLYEIVEVVRVTRL